MIGRDEGATAYLHPEGVYDDPKGGDFRKALYPRLRGHYQFINELKLFAEVHHQTVFSVNVTKMRHALMSSSQTSPTFTPRKPSMTALITTDVGRSQESRMITTTGIPRAMHSASSR